MKPEQMTCNFGEHLTIDGYLGSYELLNSRERVLRCLEELPDMLGMKKIADAHVVFAEEDPRASKDPGGWSGYVLIAESHISLHTFPGRGFLSADVYTCKNGMNARFIIDYLIRLFDLAEVETHLIKRGTRYPVRNIQESCRLLQGAR